MRRPVDRRGAVRLMGGGAIGAALALSHGRALAGETGRPVMVDSALAYADRAAALKSLGRARPLPIEADLVAQWRRGLGEQVAQAGGGIAYVRWDKAFVLAGLAREVGLPVRQQRIGRALFRIEIGRERRRETT